MSTRTIYLHNPAYQLAAVKQSLNDAQERGELFSTYELMLESGFAYHYRASENQTAYDLAHGAVTHWLESKAPVPAESIQGILYATCLTLNGNLGNQSNFASHGDVKVCMDFPVSHLQADFGFDNAFVMGLNQTACTSLLGALRVARGLLIAEQNLQNLLCLTADRFPAGAKYEQSFNLISDAAACVLVSTTPGPFEIVACHQITNGAMAQANDDETAGFYFNYSHRSIVETMDLVGKTVADIDWIVPQNTNQKAWLVLSSLLGVSFDQVYMPTLPDVGHCISGDNLINLHHGIQQKVFKQGQYILLPMAGFGLNWSCVLLRVTRDIT